VREVTVFFDHVDRHKGEAPEDPSHFQGLVKIQRFRDQFPGGVEIIAVHFGAAGRTRPHSHSAGQVLHVTSGKGIVATRSCRRFIEPGDIVIVTPGEWHWHGGTTSSAMTHVAMQLPGSTSWKEPELDWARDYDEM
jgi:quercetin dioxygenase-like cupin family protein